jgi:glycosyltransferase involved in cell wall biosynthesis
MLAFCCHPRGTMEHRNGWHRAVLAAQAGYETTVLYCPCSTDLDDSSLTSVLPDDLKEIVRFVPVIPSETAKKWLALESTFYAAYKHWHRLAFRTASQLHASAPFDLAHTVTLCGFREPGFLWQLDAPHVWGPIGGNHVYPEPFLKLLDRKDRCREQVRSLLNWIQLHATPRVRRAARKSSVVIAATSPAQETFHRTFGITVLKELETGISHVRKQCRPPRQPHERLKILWAGRLRGWKALPLLLHAISQLPNKQAVQLRVLGDGNSQRPWQQLSAPLGIASQIEWIPWPTYLETLPYYDWADVFAFTSLRDTSGTGLLEALAAGCPVITVGHQGAADIVDNSCGILTPVIDLPTTVQAFADAITKLQTSVDLRKQLSDGSLARAKTFLWDSRLEQTREIYERALSKKALYKKSPGASL